MPAQMPVLVPKPQVQFSERFTDPDLRRLTVAQLRKVARNKRLNVSLLSDKWEFIHVIVLEHLYGVEVFFQHVTDSKRRTIFDLPGEIRNKIYGYILIHEVYIVTSYENPVSSPSLLLSHMFYTHGARSGLELLIKQRIGRQLALTSDLRNMSWANGKLRREARDFFFSRNEVHLTGDSAFAYSNFLSDIGADGRANIVKLVLNGTHPRVYNKPFESMLHSCTALRSLTIRMHIKQILTKEGYANVEKYLKVEEEQALPMAGYTRDWLDALAILPSLETLHIGYSRPFSWIKRGILMEVVDIVLQKDLEYMCRTRLTNKVTELKVVGTHAGERYV